MKLQILAVDPTSGSTSHVTFESPNAMWDAFSTLSDEQKTYHELIGANDCQKVHFRIKILPGQEDRTEALVTAVKSAFQKIWSKKLRDDQVILTQTELPSGRVVDLVVDGYSVESSRMSISLANVIQKKAERFTLDQSVYHKNARWVCLGNYTPFADGTSVVYKTAVKPLVGEQRVFQVQTLVTYTANTEALADKFKEMVNSQGQHSEVVLGQPQSVGPEDQAVGQNDELPDSETPEQPEEECPNEEEQTNQGDLVEVDQTDGKKKPGLLNKILFDKKDKSEKKDKKEKNDKKNKKDKKEKDKKKSDKIYKSKTGVVKTVLFGKAKKRNQDTYEKEKIDEITVN